MSKPKMTDAELRRRKSLQGNIGRTTSTLGLTAATLGAGALVTSKKPGALKALRKLPGAKNLTHHGLTQAGLYTSLTAGGIGGVGGFNQARIYSEEGNRKKAKKVTIPKNYVEPSPFEDGYYGEEGHAVDFSKALQPAASSNAKPGLNGGMKAMRPAAKFKPLGQRPTSPNVKAMRPVQIGQNTAGLSGVGKALSMPKIPKPVGSFAAGLSRGVTGATKGLHSASIPGTRVATPGSFKVGQKIGGAPRGMLNAVKDNPGTAALAVGGGATGAAGVGMMSNRNKKY